MRKGIFTFLFFLILPVSSWTAGQASPRSIKTLFPINSIEVEIFEIVNKERSKHNLSPLIINEKLMKAARIQSVNMANRERMSHKLPDKNVGTLTERLDYYDYSFNAAGENIAMGYSNAQEVMKGWMSSPGHRSNILNSNYVEIGVALAISKKGNPYYTQEFGRPIRSVFKISKIKYKEKIYEDRQKSISSLMITS